MINICRKQLIEEYSYNDILTIENLGHYYLDLDGFVVYTAGKIPSYLLKIIEGATNVAITRQTNTPNWIYALGKEIVKYELNGLIIYVGY